MLKKVEWQKKEVKQNMRGGTGAVTITHYFTQDEFGAKCRLCAELLLPPGASIGPHAHQDEDEVFIIQRGIATMTDNGREIHAGPGDAVITGKGGAHSIANNGAEELVVTAVIVQY